MKTTSIYVSDEYGIVPVSDSEARLLEVADSAANLDRYALLSLVRTMARRLVSECALRNMVEEPKPAYFWLGADA